MAKSSVISKLKSLPRNRRNTTVWESMNADQRKLFQEWVDEFLKTPIREQPSYEVLAKAMSEDIGYPVSKSTLAKYINDARRR